MSSKAALAVNTKGFRTLPVQLTACGAVGAGSRGTVSYGSSHGAISSSRHSSCAHVPHNIMRRAVSTAAVAAPPFRETLRVIDFEAYACGSLLPSGARSAYFACRSYAHEVSAVRDMASSSATARVRLAFWREVLAAAFRVGGVADAAAPPPPQTGTAGAVALAAASHPLTGELAASVRAHALTRRWFERVVDARDAELDGVTHASVGDLESFSEATQSSLLYLVLEALGVRDEHADAAASHVGRALGIAHVIRTLGVNGRKGLCSVPNDVLLAVRGFAEYASLCRTHLTDAPAPFPLTPFRSESTCP